MNNKIFIRKKRIKFPNKKSFKSMIFKEQTFKFNKRLKNMKMNKHINVQRGVEENLFVQLYKSMLKCVKKFFSRKIKCSTPLVRGVI